MAFTFKKATKEGLFLKAALVGPSGSGKTWSALAMAKALGAKVAVIDSERGSARLYADHFEFDVLELETFEPETYVQALHDAEAAGYDVVIVDSLSHAWMGKGGALEQIDIIKSRSGSGNSFTAWRDVTPKHNELVDTMLRLQAHLIVTMRAKTEYVLNEKNGKKTPEKVGMAAIQRDGMEYEFQVVGDMTLDHDWIITKTRCDALDGKMFRKPGAEVAGILKSWLGQAPERVERPAPTGNAPAVATEVVAKFIKEAVAATTLEQLSDVGKRAGEAIPRGTPERRAFLDAYNPRRSELEALPATPAPIAAPVAAPPAPAATAPAAQALPPLVLPTAAPKVDDPEREAIQSEPPNDDPIPAWVAHLAPYQRKPQVANSFAKHRHEFGHNEDRARAAAHARLVELGCTDISADAALDAAVEARAEKVEAA